jgi:hydroxypyruvate isomerase
MLDVGTAALFGLMIAVPGIVGYALAGQDIPGLLAHSIGYINLPAAFIISCATFVFAPQGVKIAHKLNARKLRIALPMLGLNTPRGDVAGGENGLSALSGREDDARAAIDEALAYAEAIEASAVHVMAGFATGPEAHATFVANLQYACDRAAHRTILIEPLNRHDAPGYFLETTDQAKAVIADAARPNLNLMFDCYHVGRTEGDLTTRVADLLPLIGHIQFASVPDRGTPDHGEVNYAHVFDTIAALGWTKPLGSEYKPTRPVEQELGWMTELARRDIRPQK